MLENDQFPIVDVLLDAVAWEYTHAEAAERHQDGAFDTVNVPGAMKRQSLGVLAVWEMMCTPVVEVDIEAWIIDVPVI